MKDVINEGHADRSYQLANEILKGIMINPDGGTLIGGIPLRLSEVKSGFVVGGERPCLTFEDIKEADAGKIFKWLENGKTNKVIGWWMDDEGEIIVDECCILDERLLALNVARERKENFIYDIKEDLVVPVILHGDKYNLNVVGISDKQSLIEYLESLLSLMKDSDEGLVEGEGFEATFFLRK